ncbi:MAG: hypothetical protein IPK16_12660 [Anaerolineales bacterium]|nr:hypothetical protein [Anaerolineales bacterium]
MEPAQCGRLPPHLKLGGWLTGQTVSYRQDRRWIHRVGALDALGDLTSPILYDVDAGHLPPQLMLVNGARAVINYERGYPHIGVHAKFSILQTLMP